MNRVIVIFIGLLISLLIIILATCNSSDSIQEVGSEYSLVKLFNLPSDVYESSGVIIYDSLAWTFNDSGHDAAVYGISLKTGGIIKKLKLKDAENVDWEDIAQDASSIYIGDFGNAMGNRKDLCIYKISKSSIGTGDDQQVNTKKIDFSFNDQTNFAYEHHVTPYDCEAMAVVGDSLTLFTKDWVNNITSVYRLSKFEGSHIAERIGEIDSDGLITGADYNSQTDTYALIGYNSYVPFVIFLNSINKDFEIIIDKRFSFYSEYGVQMEGISFFNDQLYITSENSISTQALYIFTKQ